MPRARPDTTQIRQRRSPKPRAERFSVFDDLLEAPAITESELQAIERYLGAALTDILKAHDVTEDEDGGRDMPHVPSLA